MRSRKKSYLVWVVLMAFSSARLCVKRGWRVVCVASPLQKIPCTDARGITYKSYDAREAGDAVAASEAFAAHVQGALTGTIFGAALGAGLGAAVGGIAGGGGAAARGDAIGGTVGGGRA